MAEEYIKRESAIEAIENDCSELVYYTKEEAIQCVKAIPAADVVEVVRCRECKHWKPSGSKAGNSFSDMEYIGGCEFTKYCRRESDFCSYGVRKEGADSWI